MEPVAGLRKIRAGPLGNLKHSSENPVVLLPCGCWKPLLPSSSPGMYVSCLMMSPILQCRVSALESAEERSISGRPQPGTGVPAHGRRCASVTTREARALLPFLAWRGLVRLLWLTHLQQWCSDTSLRTISFGENILNILSLAGITLLAT